MTPTNSERVEKALLGAGQHGVTAHDFKGSARRRVIDGGRPIHDFDNALRQLRARGVKIVPYGNRRGHQVYILAAFEPPYVTGWACFACGAKLGGAPPGTFADGCPECGGFPVGRLQVVAKEAA